ncbi:MAG: Adenylate cyclase [uncultured Rubrobacteraceae bacterium]|uniref:Adenylate cyclase n=1 Tax=uncultured Rubrobacteraceae bacterium TaxID=349277 RepID=A0A6J4Q723_9ACTN|nr:MAG: Adenylate cyclase [uncultured Rubrobacteraceae bacterium]
MAQQRSRQKSSGGGRSGRRKSSGKTSAKRRSPVDHHEVEWQFDATELESVGAWLREHSSGSGLVVEPESEEKITDTYYDASDWRFYRAGYALRIRKTGSSAEATMKSLSPAEGNVRRRREITEPLGDDSPATLGKAPGPVGERARSLLGGRDVRPMFEIRTHRQRFALILEGTADASESGASANRVRIGEVLLDSSEIPLGGGREAANLSRVEVEAGAGTAPTPDLRGFVDEMQYALDLKPASISKFETGLYATGLSPGGDTEAGPTEIGPLMTLGEVAFAVLRRQFVKMRAHEPGTRLGEDPEALHDMRVATRRMRAAMKVFEGALPERARWFREELRWVARALGDVRDLDVQIDRLESWRGEVDEEGSEFLDKILDVLGKRRAEARGRMLEALDSARYERLETSFGEMLRRGPGAERKLAQSNGHAPEGEPVTSAAPDLISARYRKWRKAARRLDESSPPEDFHDLRKKGKRLRYTLEFVSEVYGKPVAALVSPLKALQDDLGDHQDAIVAAGTLRELGTTTDGPRVPRGAAFTMGVFTERYLSEAAGIRSGVLGSKPLRALARGKSWKGFEKIMKEAAKSPQKAKGSGKIAR